MDSKNAQIKHLTDTDGKPPVRRCFVLMEDEEPPKAGMYDVITNKGRVVSVYYEKFCGNHIWEIHWREHALDEKVIAWSGNIA